MSLPLWAPLSIEIVQTFEGFHIKLTTDIPCHLTMLWTTNEVWTHRRTVNRRGLIAHFLSYWCFVAWHELEQKEPGDTLEHCFKSYDWQYLEQRWFHFVGTVSAVDSPSNTPIFDRTYTYPPPSILIPEEWRWWGFPVPSLTLEIIESWSS